MNLYLVIPLVLVKYRKRFETLSRQKNLNREEFDAIVQDVLHDVEEIIGISGKCEDKGVMDEQTKDVILSATMELYNQLHQKYIQDNESREKVENMIESVTQKISRKWHQIGIEEGIERGIEQGMERGMEQGIERGIEQGKIEEARNIARNLIMLGMEDEFIKKATGLSGDEIRRLKI
jgi:predicted transposase/invertase (TIGR01784 family)